MLTGDLELVKSLARHKTSDTTLSYLDGVPRNKVNPALWSLTKSLVQ